MLSLPLVVFTDPLDLFPPQGRSWESAAAETVHEMARRSVPLVFVSRGTRAELEVVRRKMGNQHPFITESGGGLFVPEGHFRQRPQGAETIRHYHQISFARPYAEACSALDEAAQEAGVEVVGFHHMSAREVAENSGLPPRIADLARLREYDELFFFAGEEGSASGRLAEAARPGGWKITQGERFWHFSGGGNVAGAMRRVMELYRTARHGRVRSIAIGANRHQAPMLASAGRAFVLPLSNGRYDEELLESLPAARRAETGGVEGWSATVLAALGADA